MKTKKPIVGAYNVTWKYGTVLGGEIKVYIGIIDADNIRAGNYTLEHAIKFVIATAENLRDVNSIQLIKY